VTSVYPQVKKCVKKNRNKAASILYSSLM